MKTSAGNIFRFCLTTALFQLLPGATYAVFDSTFIPNQKEATDLMEAIDWEDYYSDMEAIENDESILEQWSERVQEFVEHPLDLNLANKEDLAELPFMNDKLIEEISYYLYRYGPMKELSELRLIEGINEINYRLLCHLVCLGEGEVRKSTALSWKTVLNRGKHDFRLQLGRTLEEKKGYKPTAVDGKPYQGDAWSSTLRYGFTYKNNIQFGFTTQKDAGESWIGSGSMPDYFSAHVLVKNMGWCKAFVLGDYSITLGQGLLCGQSFLVGKGSFTGNPGSVGSPLKRHASCGESSYFKGLAFDIDLLDRLKTENKGFNLSLIGFYSKQRIDGTAADSTLTRIVATGLHRTREEREQQKTASLQTAGVSLGIKTRWGRFNVNGLKWKMDKTLTPTWQPYNQYQLRGSTGSNASLDYRALLGPFTCFGEVAVDQAAHWAFQCGLYTCPLSTLSVTIHYRNHGVKYNALFAGAFGEHANASNERGLYTSLSWELIKHLTLSGYVDAFVFPWLTYRCDEPSQGNQRCIQGLVQLNTAASFLIRFNEKYSQQNGLALGGKNPLSAESVLRHLRFQFTDGMEQWESRSILDITHAANSLEPIKTTGYSLSQQFKYTPVGLPVQFTAKLSCFDIPDYENRVSSFEASLPGSSRFTSLYGEGYRWGLLCKYTMGESVQWWLDVSRLSNTDGSKVGTGLEEVDGNHLTTIQLMFRMKL